MFYNLKLQTILELKNDIIPLDDVGEGEVLVKLLG